MLLAGLVALGEDLLICDLAETYGIHDMEAYPPDYIATLASGLREDSRVKMRLSGAKATTDRMVAAYAADRLANLVWMLSEDGRNGRNRPKSILAALTGETGGESGKAVAYDSPEAFEAAMKKYEVK